ncbi:glycerol-3-phosphate dehydrogenase, anaerobic, B subunit [Propionibacterium sp. oral taxon 192 str. F0372]|uniref:glycerol-3-phosphate dehydrogenase subunit GlpB n=1 Tax=Propionibacterium sp. oral taxon 192 TaxID=671222 RepID=UPI0003540DCD|nr:glycerol-3-phosphate dehydrogenase subunit GlpB [Propionibacterium sp. oral taxon 192]EPH02440.1 glycerol-3-phosphate dehydrogenase, anaerobic, B subunit [Propionibacterium sp. oral taxon 192 str. F0372]
MRIIVIGMGPAGLSAALRAVEAGHDVRLISKGEGGFQLSQGTLDVLASLDGHQIDQPLVAIASLGPEHPYAGIGADRVREAVNWAAERIGPELLVGSAEHNLVLPTAVGAMRPTAFAQPSMVAAAATREYAVVGVRQLKDMPAELMAGNLGAESAWIDLPARAGEQDPTSLTYARALEDPEFADRFADAVAKAAPPGEVILLPGVLGTRPGTWRRIRDRIGREIAEVPLVPPSVPGIRLHDAMVAAIRAAHVKVVIGSRVVGFEADGDRLSGVRVGIAGRTRTFGADAVIHAPGGFSSGALDVDSYGRITERVFGLPLTADDATGLITPSWFDPQPLFEVGVRADVHGRAVNADNEPVFRNLYVAGDIIAGAQRWIEKSGEGTAIATALRAADGLAEGA